MKKNTQTKFLTFLLCTLCILLISSCGPSAKSVKRYQLLERGGKNPSTENELKDAIAKYEEDVLKVMLANEQIGIWHKLLATRYIEKQMYNEALESLQKAIEYFPTNQNLYYHTGISAGHMAKSSLDFFGENSSKRQEYLTLAEQAYKRAIELQSDYTNAMYGLAVLYVFELEKPADAIPLLENLLDIEPKNNEAKFMLARAYYMNYDFANAVSVYEDIIATATNEQVRYDAEVNKEIALEALYE